MNECDKFTCRNPLDLSKLFQTMTIALYLVKEVYYAFATLHKRCLNVVEMGVVLDIGLLDCVFICYRGKSPFEYSST